MSESLSGVAAGSASINHRDEVVNEGMDDELAFSFPQTEQNLKTISSYEGSTI